ncbi:MAG: hypothetical protein JNL95_05470 [Chitinophagales bacterium]|nr:hypothetical protein [Chitinophagales bacterium]
MKKASSALFELVQSLSLSEKRYIHLYLSKHSKEATNRYTEFFEQLSEPKTYNEHLLFSQFPKGTTKNDFAVLKKQLYEQILHGLATYDVFANPEQQLSRGIYECRILMQKGLFQQAEKRIIAMAEKADEMDIQELKLQIHQLKLQLIARNYYRHTKESTIEEWQQEADGILQKIQTSIQYKYLSNKVYQMQYASGVRGSVLAKRMESITQQNAFMDIKNATTQRARLDYFQINALYHFTNSEPQKAYEYNKKLLEELEATPLLMQINADRYFAVLNNFLIDCFILKEFNTLEEGLEKLKGLSKISTFRKLSNFEANSFRLSTQLQLNYWMEQGNFNSIIRSIPEVQNGIKRFEQKIVIHTRFTLLYLLAYGCFIVEKYDDAIDLLQPILQEKETKVVEDIQFGARMLQMLCFFEKNEMLLVQSFIQSLRKTILQKKLNLPVHKLVIKYIQQVSKGKLNYASLAEKMEEVIHGEGQKNELNLFNFSLWARAKRDDVTIKEIWKK